MTPRFLLRFVFATAALMLSLAGATPSVSAQDAAEPALGPPPDVPPIEVVGHASGVDLAELGPHFARPWLADLRRHMGQSADAPERIERHHPSTGRRTRTTFRYDDADRPLEARTAVRRDTGWVPTRRTTYSYRHGRLATQHAAMWAGDQWRPERRWTFHYDRQERLARAIQYTRSDTAWTPATRLLFTTEAETYAIEHHIREDGAWAPVARAAFAAPDPGRRVTRQVALREEADWAPRSRTTFLYNMTGRPVEAYTRIWTGRRWTDGPQHLYTHALHGDRVIQTTETWMGTIQLNTRTATFTYASPPAEPLILGARGLK